MTVSRVSKKPEQFKTFIQPANQEDLFTYHSDMKNNPRIVELLFARQYELMVVELGPIKADVFIKNLCESHDINYVNIQYILVNISKVLALRAINRDEWCKQMVVVGFLWDIPYQKIIHRLAGCRINDSISNKKMSSYASVEYVKNMKAVAIRDDLVEDVKRFCWAMSSLARMCL